jgi:hypothetical protein
VHAQHFRDEAGNCRHREQAHGRADASAVRRVGQRRSREQQHDGDGQPVARRSVHQRVADLAGDGQPGQQRD